MTTLTKQTIINKVAEKNNPSQPEAREPTEALLEIIKTTLVSGEDIMVSGFGKFQVNEKKQKKL